MRKDTHREFVRLAPLALALSHHLPSLLDARQCPATTNVGDDTERCLPTHTEVGAVFGGKHALQVRMYRGVRKVRVWRRQQLAQGQIQHAGQQPLHFYPVAIEEGGKVGLGIRECSIDVGRMREHQPEVLEPM